MTGRCENRRLLFYGCEKKIRRARQIFFHKPFGNLRRNELGLLFDPRHDKIARLGRLSAHQARKDLALRNGVFELAAPGGFNCIGLSFGLGAARIASSRPETGREARCRVCEDTLRIVFLQVLARGVAGAGSEQDGCQNQNGERLKSERMFPPVQYSVNP